MAAVNNMSKSIKILMLHGYTQSGPLFHAKTKALEKSLHKAFPGISLHYPTGPLRLKVSEVPGHDSSADPSDEIEAYGWWRRSDTSDPPEYIGIEDGLATVAKTIEAEGPFDGVLGFSQGAAMAAMVTSLLEGDLRKEAFKASRTRSKLAMPFPASFAHLTQPPLKFCVAYSGFIAPGERYSGFYQPCIRTPVCHFVGSMDTVVEEARTNTLIDAAGGPDKTTVVVHPGGHFVPNQRQYLDTVVSFIQAHMMNTNPQSTTPEERVEEMDVPF